MPVSYDGKKIVPAPFIRIQKNNVKNAAGNTQRKSYTITATSKVIAWAGSPSSLGVFWTASGDPPIETIAFDARLAAMREKEGALIRLFADEGLIFEITPLDGSVPIKFNPRVTEIQFAEGIWVETVPYTITMEADRIWFGDNLDDYISDITPDETWAIEVSDDELKSYRITHSVSSQQKDQYDATGGILQKGYLYAKSIVTPYVSGGASFSFFSFIQDLSTYNQTSYVRNENIDVNEGKYGINESWVYIYGASTEYTEKFSVITKTDESSRITVNVDGVINGANTTSATDTATVQAERYTNAVAAWITIQATLLARAQSHSGATLNPTSLNNTVTKNPLLGSVTYSYQYDDRANFIIIDARSETITFNYDNPADIVAVITVLGRPQGPIFQNTQSKTESTVTITYEGSFTVSKYDATAPPPGMLTIATALTQFVTIDNQVYSDIVLPLKPTASAFIRKDSPTWNPRNGHYSRSTTWVY